MTWQRDALCREVDHDAFFPEKGQANERAKAVCANCPVSRKCLAYALEHDEWFGIWGGRASAAAEGLMTAPAYNEHAARVVEDQRLALEVRALRLLNSGDSINDVAKITTLTVEQVTRLRRDFPATPPKPVVAPCQHHLCGQPTRAGRYPLGWVYAGADGGERLKFCSWRCAQSYVAKQVTA